MITKRTSAMTIVLAAALAACASQPNSNPNLEQARSEYRSAQDTPEVRDLAGGELKQAADSLSRADAAEARGDKTEEINHLAYMAKQRVAIAREVASRKTAEQQVANAGAARDKVRLTARTDEADSANRKADSANRKAAASEQDAQGERARNVLLEAQIKDLNAKKTERGLVVTFGDVLFDSDKSQLKPNGLRNVDKLVAFLKQYPLRNVLVEGFADQQGTESHNQALSERRADAVRAALVEDGVDGARVTMHGYGEAFPVASNKSAEGRQLNRRVEVVISEEGGNIVPR